MAAELTLFASWRRLLVLIGVVALVAFVAGYCARGREPEGRQAIATADSARIAALAFDKGQALERWRFRQQQDSIGQAVARADSVHRASRAGTDQASAGAHAAAAAADLAIANADLASAHAAVVLLEDSLNRYDSAVVKERRDAADVEKKLAADTASKAREIVRLGYQIDTLQQQRDAALGREHRLAEEVGGWRLTLSVGPVIAYTKQQIVAAPVAAGVMLSHPIQLPRLLPRL